MKRTPSRPTRSPNSSRAGSSARAGKESGPRNSARPPRADGGSKPFSRGDSYKGSKSSGGNGGSRSEGRSDKPRSERSFAGDAPRTGGSDRYVPRPKGRADARSPERRSERAEGGRDRPRSFDRADGGKRTGSGRDDGPRKFYRATPTDRTKQREKEAERSAERPNSGFKPRFNNNDARPARGERTERANRPDRNDRPRNKAPMATPAPYGADSFEAPLETATSLQRLQGPLLWGFHAVRAAYLNPLRRIQRFVATAQALEGFAETITDATGAGLKRPEVEIIDKTAFDRIVPPGSVHQGLALMVEPLEILDTTDLLEKIEGTARSMVVILDQVTDPHNVGAILRTAAAFGATAVMMQDRHAPELTGVLAKTASGAVDVISVLTETNLSRAIEKLKEADFMVIGLDEEGDPLADMPTHPRMALVLGAEGSGLRRLVADHCDALAALPTIAPINSLNVSNAAAVALYAMMVKA